MRGILSFILLLLSWFPAYAQNDLKGTVTSQQGEPLPGVNIYVSEKTSGTITDKTGRYLIKDLPNGKLRIQYSYIGYGNRLETVMMEGSPVEMNITMSQEPIETHEVVVVGGYNSTQHENAVKIDVIKSDMFNGSGSPNFAESLTRVSGIDMISKGPGISKPVIRGLSKNDILVLNNGVRWENYQYSDHHPLGIDEFGVESVEIIKGPASLLYGSDAIGGVIDFVKEKPAPVGQVMGDYNLQLFSTTLGANNNLGLKGASQNFFWGIRGGNKTNADYLQGGGAFVPNSRFNEWSVKADAGITGKSGVFKLFCDVSEQKLGLVEPEALPMIVERGRKNEIWYQSFRNKMLSSQNKLYLGKYKVEINAAIQQTGLMHFDDRTDPFIEMNLSTLTYETKLYLPPSPNGGEYIAGFQGFNQHNRNLNSRETMLLPDAAIDNYSGFALLQRTFLGKIKVQAGARYDHRMIATSKFESDTTFHQGLTRLYNSFSGSAGANYDLNETLFLRANFSAAFRSPNLAELTSNGLHENRYEIGNPGLSPQHAYESDISAHYHSENFSFDLAGFYNRIKDYIFITPTAENHIGGYPVYRYTQSDARLRGGEASFHIHPKPVEWLHLETTFSAVNGKQDNDDYLPLIPAQKLRFELRAEKIKLLFLENAYAAFVVLKAFDQNKYAPEEEATPGYLLVDVSAGAKWKISGQLIIIGLSANNIFDIKYVDHLSTLREAGYFNTGRNIAFNLKIPFAFKH